MVLGMYTGCFNWTCKMFFLSEKKFRGKCGEMYLFFVLVCMLEIVHPKIRRKEKQSRDSCCSFFADEETKAQTVHRPFWSPSCCLVAPRTSERSRTTVHWEPLLPQISVQILGIGSLGSIMIHSFQAQESDHRIFAVITLMLEPACPSGFCEYSRTEHDECLEQMLGMILDLAMAFTMSLPLRQRCSEARALQSSFWNWDFVLMSPESSIALIWWQNGGHKALSAALGLKQKLGRALLNVWPGCHCLCCHGPQELLLIVSFNFSWCPSASKTWKLFEADQGGNG